MSYSIAYLVKKIKQEILTYSQDTHGSQQTIQLLAVTKGRSISDIQALLTCNQYAFAENYLQEALPKIHALKKEKNIQWHFIGTIQKNKVKKIAESFDWVQSLDSLEIAARLHYARPSYLPCLQVCIQVTLTQTPHRAGISLPFLPSFLLACKDFTRLKIRGLMFMPHPKDDIKQSFLKISTAYKYLQQWGGSSFNILSMGTSQDFPLAIQAGANLIRIGHKLFETN